MRRSRQRPVIRKLPIVITKALVLLMIATATFAQTPGGTPNTQTVVILFRNVSFTNDTGTLSPTSVLVSAGKIVREGAGLAAPAGATVIDAGGNLLSISADGTIDLKPVTVADRTKETEPVQKTAVPQQAAPAVAPSPDANLSAQVVDPTSPLKTITFQNKYSPSLWGVKDRQNDVDTLLAVPFKFLGHLNILKATIPYNTSSASGNRGLSDVTIFDVMILPQKWGTLAVGPVWSFGVNKGSGVDTFAAGPAIGAVFKKEKWLYGVFNQNLFSGSVATSQLQPILAYTVNRKISLALGDLQFIHDWKKDRWTQAPVGFQFNYIAMFGKQPVRLILGPQYNIKNEYGSRKWTFTTGFALILP